MSSPRSEIVLRFLAAPMDITYGGTVHGGKLLEWIDKAGYACAVGWSSRYCVTAYVGDVRFARPVNIGDLVEVAARLVHTGRSGMHIAVTVSSADPKDRIYTEATRCLTVFVAVDESGRPVPVPTWEPRSADDVELQAAVVAKVELRADIEASMKQQTYSGAGTAPRSILRFLAAPTDVNWGGKVHGGTVMRWIGCISVRRRMEPCRERRGLCRRRALLPSALDRVDRRNRGTAAAYASQQHAHLGARQIRRPQDTGTRPDDTLPDRLRGRRRIETTGPRDALGAKQRRGQGPRPACGASH